MQKFINFTVGMKTLLIHFILLLSLFDVCRVSASGHSAVDSLMKQLDDVIANRAIYLAEKEARLSELRDNLFRAENDRETFEALRVLFDEYHPFNADSAYNISLRQETVARRIGDQALIMNARMNRASILSATGMYHETLEIVDSIGMDQLPGYLRPYYYHIKRTVYGRLADYAVFLPEKRKYAEMTNMYRDSLIAVNDPNSLSHVITKADLLNVKGLPSEAIDVLNSFMSNRELSEHENAICSWTLAESYAKLKNAEKQKELLILSAISDMKSSVREYISLRELALLLYKEGDLNRAYDFMSIAVDDAAKCNARQRIVEMNDSYPMINGIYVETIESQKNVLVRTIAIITLLSLVLVAFLVYMRKQMQRIANARRETETAYLQLNDLTEQLKESNERLCEANDAIAEISELKEVYIGRYMDQCLVYIDKLDSYRKSVAKLVGSGRPDELKKFVKSTTFIDDELKAFYDQFDKTFLQLYPTFVEDFNRLLLPEEAILPKKRGSLNTELRIFALIRLGISDSDRIAKFLRYSLTTIYNYRAKVRNKAKGDRNKLEEELLKIGRAESRSDAVV